MRAFPSVRFLRENHENTEGWNGSELLSKTGSLLLGFLSFQRTDKSGRRQGTRFLRALGNCVFKVRWLGPYYLCHMIAYDAETDRCLFYSSMGWVQLQPAPQFPQCLDHKNCHVESVRHTPAPVLLWFSIWAQIFTVISGFSVPRGMTFVANRGLAFGRRLKPYVTEK